MNRTIDFLIVTDQDIPNDASNIKVLNCTLNQVKNRIVKYIGFDVWLEKPYKLCDFRPLYCYLFQEYIGGYAFWGYCDCDLIFGDIRKFVTDDILERNDCIGAMGHFHLQRCKDPKYEGVWKSARGLWNEMRWQDVFKSPRNEWFDECPYGVSGRYYEMYPGRFWSGFEPEGRCYDAPSSSYLQFIDGYNCYELYKNDPGYQNHTDRLAFWKREKCSELKNIVYIKEKTSLYALGINSGGEIEKREIMYAHFIKRKFTLKTSNLQSYMIYPNVFSRKKILGKLSIMWYANNPLLLFRMICNRLFTKKICVLNGK